MFNIRNSRAFTLIELLVVISIIAILMAIMMPALRRAREQARMSICKSNLRQISTAVTIYAVDNSGRFPPSILLDKGQSHYLYPGFLTVNPAEYWTNHPLPSPKERTLSTYLGSLVADGSIFFCPLSPQRDKEVITAIYDDPFGGKGTYVCSYGMFWGGYEFKDSNGNTVFNGPKGIASSSNSILCSDIVFEVRGDMQTTHQSQMGGVPSGSAGQWKITASATEVLQRLNSNYAFVDGHVETIRGDSCIGLPYYNDANKLYMPESGLKMGSR